MITLSTKTLTKYSPSEMNRILRKTTTEVIQLAGPTEGQIISKIQYINKNIKKTFKKYIKK